MKKVLSLILVLVLAIGLLAGCGGDKENDGSGSDTNSTNVNGLISTADVNFIANGESVYRIVRPDGDSVTGSAAQLIFKHMKSKLGVTARNVSDTTADEDSYEILLGLTNRNESKQALAYLDSKTGARYNDYIICTIGKKICIYAESTEAMDAAAEYFVKTYAVSQTVKGGIVYTKAAEGNFESLKVNGVEIGKFDFIRPHYNSSWLTECEVEEAIETIYAKTGYKMQFKHDTQSEPSDYEIIVGNANRDGVEAITDYDQFKITFKGKKIYINGGSAHATAMGVSEFVKLLKGTITDADSVIGSYETAIKTYDKTTNYYKTWGDDFDGTAVDTSKWWLVNENQLQATGQNGKKSLRSDDPERTYVRDGKFTICAGEDENYYYGGMLRTEGIMNYKYGYAEISALIPHGDSFWTAWWTYSDDFNSSLYPDEPALSLPEIDIFECFGNSSFYAANCHSWATEPGKLEYGFVQASLDANYSNEKKYQCPDNGVKLGDGFHTYGFLWDNTKMSFVCDGNLYFTYDTTTTEQDMETFNHSMYFIFSLATAFANSPGGPITQKAEDWTNTNKLSLDWINLYQKDDDLHQLILRK